MTALSLHTLANSRAGRRQTLSAAAVVVVFVLATAMLLPWARVPLAVAGGFIPIYQTALIVVYALSAYLLAAQFRRSHARPMLILGAGCGLTAAICFLQLMSFPNMLTPGRLFGDGPDTTTWLWTFWHLTPPIGALLYLHADGTPPAPARARRALLRVGAWGIAILAGVALASTRFVAFLPKSVEGDDYGTLLIGNGIGPAIAALTIFAAIVAVRCWRRTGGVLQLWVAVSLALLTCDTMLTLAGGSRASLGRYAGRFEALLAGVAVLAVYLREVNFLYGRAEEAVASREGALAALESVRDGLDLALEAAGMGEWAFDPASGNWTGSKRHDQLFGYDGARADWSWDAVLQHVMPEDRAEVARAFASDRIAFECRIMRADGRESWIAVLGRTDHGAPTRVHGVVMDVTERRGTDERMRQAQRMEAIGQLTGGVAHDFNNLLTVVIGSLDMILRAPTNVSRVERLGRAAMEAARRGARLTGQLLSFSRRQLLRPEHVNPNRLVTEFQELIRRALGEAVTLRFELEPTIDPALIDRAGLETALLNLAANARDAMGGKGLLVVRTENVSLSGEDMRAMSIARHDAAPGDYVVVSATDNGAGMSAEIAAQAFEPFFTTKEIGKGTGLGLSQVYGFARQSGGFVRMRTALGEGTTVAIYLPRSVSQAVPGPIDGDDQPRALPLRSAAAGEVVLVVEDDDHVRRMAVESLGELGYATLEAADARAALRTLEGEARIDILFSDVVMPGGMNGAQLAMEARRLRPALRVLLTSGYTASALASEHDAQTDMEILHKPYLREELASKIRLVAGG